MDARSVVSARAESSIVAGASASAPPLIGIAPDCADSTLDAVLDTFAVCLCIVDGGRCIRRLNSAARESIGAGELLMAREGRLCGLDSQGTSRLSSAVSKVCGLQLEQEAFQLAGGRTGVRMQVQVRALGSDGPQASPPTQRLALVLFGQTNSDRRDASMLRRLFGLSNAESCLLEELLRGKRLDECAAARQITMGTARTQLKSIFLKTGASSQGQLIAIARTLPAAAPLQPSQGQQARQEKQAASLAELALSMRHRSPTASPFVPLVSDTIRDPRRHEPF